MEFHPISPSVPKLDDHASQKVVSAIQATCDDPDLPESDDPAAILLHAIGSSLPEDLRAHTFNYHIRVCLGLAYAENFPELFSEYILGGAIYLRKMEASFLKACLTIDLQFQPGGTKAGFDPEVLLRLSQTYASPSHLIH